jgi:hypothetical protein
VLLQGAAVKVVGAFWSWYIGAIAGCRCRALLLDFSQKQQEVQCSPWRIIAKKKILKT